LSEMAAGTGLETNNIVNFLTVLGGVTYATVLPALTAVTAAEKTALASTMTNINAAIDFETATNANNVTAAQLALTAAATPTAAESASLGGVAAISALLAANSLANVLNEDTTTQTAAELAAGGAAYAAALNSALLANNTVYAAEWAAMTGAEQSTILDAIEADIAADTNVQVAFDPNSGAVISSDNGVNSDLAAAATLVDANAPAGTTITISVAGVVAGTIDLAIAAVGTYQAAVEDQAYDAALIAQFNELLALMETVADAENGGELAQAMADLVATESLGDESIDLNGGAATDGNDVFVFGVSSGVAQTIGTAAAYLGETGTDTVIIQGDYTFVTITEAQNDAIATTAVGDQAAMEIFVYQDATTGNAILHVEENAFDGSLESNGAMTTVTLTDVTFADLTQIDVDGYTVLVAEAAVA